MFLAYAVAMQIYFCEIYRQDLRLFAQMLYFAKLGARISKKSTCRIIDTQALYTALAGR